MILKPIMFATICQYVLREGDRQTYCNRFNNSPHASIGDFDIYLNPVRDINCGPDAEYDGIVFKMDSSYTSVRCSDDALEFDAKDRPMLERYFALAIAHISSQS